MPEIRPATREQVAQTRVAYIHLQMALALLVKAEAPRAAAKVRRAIKSAGGAVRHVDHRHMRSKEFLA